MLKFKSSSARIVNTKRAVNECMEVALGEEMSSADLLIFHASIGHDFKALVEFLVSVDRDFQDIIRTQSVGGRSGNTQVGRKIHFFISEKLRAKNIGVQGI